MKIATFSIVTANLLLMAGCHSEKVNCCMENSSTLTPVERVAQDACAEKSVIPFSRITAVNGEIHGAAQYYRRFDVPSSPYSPAHDFYHSSPTKTLIKLKQFKTYQQTDDYNCGAAVALMALHWLGVVNVSENQLYHETVSSPAVHDCGPSPEVLAKVFTSRGFSVETSLSRANADGVSFQTPEALSEYLIQQINAQSIILVASLAWGSGHWSVIVGYDTMGTEDIGDDRLIFADPYDTSDHCQDGYVTKDFDRFFYEWQAINTTTGNHGTITRQPFVTVKNPYIN